MTARRSRRIISARPSPMCASRSPACRWSRAACSSSSKRASASRSRCRTCAAPSSISSASGASRTCGCSRPAPIRAWRCSWQLIPVRRITKITVTGSRGAAGAEIRREITDRFGATPSTNRIDEMALRVTDVLPRPRLRAGLGAAARAGGRPGSRGVGAGPDDRRGARAWSSARSRSPGQPLDAEAEVIRAARLAAGTAFRSSRARRAHRRRYEESLRERGYYQAPRARIARAARRRQDR